MFLFYNQKFFVILLIEILLILSDNGSLFLTIRKSTVTANDTFSIAKPFLQIEKRTKLRLTITNPLVPHFLLCNATSDSPYKYEYKHTWYRNDIEQDTYPLRRNDFHIFRNGTLRLPTNERASGVYRCKINANSTAVLSESITVQFPVLKRLPSPANINASSNSPFRLDCPIHSVPAANISWYYDNESLTKHFKESRFCILESGSLVIRKISLEDSGKYKCLAHNSFAVKHHRQFVWTVSVTDNDLQNDEGSSNSNELVPQLQNQTQYIPQGGEFRLQCLGVNEGVAIEWWFQSSLTAPPIKLNNNSEVYHVNKAIIADHNGFFICKAKTQSQVFQIIVTEPPSIISEFPSSEAKLTARYAFNCRATGHPKPSLHWYHNGLQINSSYSRYINGNELKIDSFDPEEGGIYQCFARNIAGEDYTSGELSYHVKNENIKKNPLRNIKCYAHSFNTINVTFESTIPELSEALFIVYIIQNKPHVWTSPYAPMKLSHHTYAVITGKLPVYRPFQLITRVLFPSSQFGPGGFHNQQQTIESSLRSIPLTCCTQGLLVHLLHLGNDTFVTWSQPDLNNKKYFILQFSMNYTNPHPEQLIAQTLKGTFGSFELTEDDVSKKITNIERLSDESAEEVLHRAESKVNNNDVRSEHLESDEDVFNIVFHANVTGLLLSNFSRVKLRVLLITSENEDLKQDFRYVQWKIIKNDTSELSNMPFHLTTVESRMLVFHFLENFNETCVYVCKLLIQFPIIRKEEPKCDKRTGLSSTLVINNLKPSARYRLHFSSCETHIFYGQLDVVTLPDPPGTISNQRVVRSDKGLKLVWDPPLKPNGRVHHYNILWTLGNITHEYNILECNKCFYKFPNVSETAKLNISVRVVGETGVGAPIYIDLRTISHHSLEIEENSSADEIYSGIAIGSALSIFCIVFFIVLMILQKKRFKSRQQGPIHLSTPTDINFGNLSNTTMPCDSAGGLSGSTIQQDCHEMQTLIPKARRNIVLLAETRLDHQIQPQTNGNGNLTTNKRKLKSQDDLGNNQTIRSGLNLSQLPLCTSTPERETRPPFFIAFNKQQSPPNAVAGPSTFSSSPSVHFITNGHGANDILTPPNSIALKIPSANLNNQKNSNNTSSTNQTATNNVQRRGSLTSTSSASNSCGSSNKKHPTSFHSNFKHSTSIDGICLLAEEESAATLTPTTELDVAKASLTNGFSLSKNSSASSTSTFENKFKNSDNKKSLGSTSASSSNSNSCSANGSSNTTNGNNTQHKNISPSGSSNCSSKDNKNSQKAFLNLNKKHLPRAFKSQNILKVPANEGSSYKAENNKQQAMQEPFKYWPSKTQEIQTRLTLTSSSLQNAASAIPSEGTSSSAKSSSTNFNNLNKLHRRPNVDPNG